MFGVIIGFDIKDYSQNEKTSDMKEQRRIFSDIINDSTKDIHIFSRKEIIDTGDGCFLLIDTGDYENVLLAMEKIQEKANIMTNIYFRGVVHVGKYEKTENIIDERTPNFIGEGINETARYLNANCLKEVLEINDKYFIFGITSEFYNYALHLDNFDINNYERYGLQVKKFSSLLYLNIKNIINKPKQEKIFKNIDFKISDRFIAFLKKSDFIYEKNNQECDLDTFFVFPELRIDKPEKDDPTKILSDELINCFIKNPFNIIMAGDDQSGKTSLCKQYYIRLFESKDFIPIYLDMRVDEKGHVIKKINNCLLTQYGKNSEDGFDNLLKILIIDNFHLLNDTQQKRYLQFINEQKNYMAIIFVDFIFMRSMEKKKLTANYKEYTIRDFGHLKRDQLIDKWIAYKNDDNTNYKKKDELSEYLNNTFLKGIMPFTPFYILTVLAAKEDFVQINGELTSKGHCYQALIYISLKKINIADDEIGAFLNILSNIAFHFYEHKIEMFSEEELSTFLNEYSKKYNMPFENNYFESRMKNSFIFQKNSMNQYSFYAQYLYHYFAAKYISEKISEENIKKYIKNIYNNLDDHANAYIGIFIIHHCKDISLIEAILNNIKLLYNEYKESSLTKEEINHIEEDAKIINREVIEAYDKSEEERKKRLLVQDDEEEENELDEEDGKVEVNKAVQRIKNAIRTIEVMGLILKNHSGEIEREYLKECFLNTLNAYRRICNMFIVEFKNNKEKYIEYVTEKIHDNNGLLSLDEKSKLAHQYYIFYNFAAIYSTIIRSANALGSKGLIKIIHDVIYEMNNPLGYCVYFQCKMWYEKDVSINDLKSKYNEFPETIKIITRKLIKEYIDLHHINIREKQTIASVFNMDLKQLTYDYEK